MEGQTAHTGHPATLTSISRRLRIRGCGAKVQRIRYASDETNYCSQCQTGGRRLADRAFSRLLHDDWPRTLEELEALRKR
jgi:formamidopyrimidine-DNA glycosylase